MKIINASPARVIPLGIQGENLAVAISFDLTSYHAEYGAGQAQLLVQRSEDKVPYPVNLKTSDHYALWEVSELDTSIPGFGRAELRWSVGEVLVKSATYSFCVFESLGEASAPPEMWQTWLDEILEAASDLQTAAKNALPYIDAATQNWYVWSAAESRYIDTGISAKGTAGPQGEQGGWYTPAVTQPDANTMRLSFSPSKEGMPAVAETDIKLPSGGGGGGSSIAIDETLTKSGQAADAKAVGDRLDSLSEEIVTTSESKVAAHNTGTDTHSDIRLLIQGLIDRLNALADSDDTTLDQLSEVVAYIKSNRSLIEAITTSKVSVADIVDNLTTNVSNKPLSAAQGVVLKTLIDALRNDKLDAAELDYAVNTALAHAKASGEFDGADGKSAYAYAVEGGYTGTEAEFAAKLAAEKFANPNALTFTGAVSATYDGSAPVSVEIPSGGGSSGGSAAEWQLLGTYKMLVSDRRLVIDLSQFEGITHFRIIGNFPKCSEDCGSTYFYLGTSFNHTREPINKQNVYAFSLLAECELVDGQLYGFIGTIDGWNFKAPASVVINTPRDSGKNTNLSIYYTNAVNDTTENTIQIWGY